MSIYQVDKVCRYLILNPEERSRFRADPRAFLVDYDLTEAEQKALSERDAAALYAMGTHPFLLNTWWRNMIEPGRPMANTEEYVALIEGYGFPDFST